MHFSRALQLYIQYLRSVMRRIYYDLVRELVVAICSLVLVALFFYIFQDFINVKLKEARASFQSDFAAGFTAALFVLSSLYLARSFHRWRASQESFEALCRRLGEHPVTIKLYVSLKTFMTQAAHFLILYALCSRYLWNFQPEHSLAAALLIFILSLVGYLLPLKVERVNRQYRPIRFWGKSSLTYLIWWRVRQMVGRNRLTSICLGLACLCLLALGTASYLSMPFGILVLLSLLAGYLTSGSLIFQLQDDMEHPFLERQCGISHNQFVNCYLALGITLGVLIGLLVILAQAIPNSSPLHLEHLKLIAIAASPCLMFSALMFQVDPRRPIIQFISNFIVSLFLGTAIYAHWASIALIPVTLYYSLQYQKDAFYQN